MLNAHILNSKVINDETKLDRMHLCLQRPGVEWASQQPSSSNRPRRRLLARIPALGNPQQPWRISKQIHPFLSSIPASPYSKKNSSGMSVILIRTCSGSFIGVLRKKFFMSMHANRAPFLENTLFSMSLMSSNCWRSLLSILVLILMLVSAWRPARDTESVQQVKNPFKLALVLSIWHLQNYGVKTRKSHGRGTDPLPVSSTKRYFKPRSVRLPYSTICTCV